MLIFGVAYHLDKFCRSLLIFSTSALTYSGCHIVHLALLHIGNYCNNYCACVSSAASRACLLLIDAAINFLIAWDISIIEQCCYYACYLYCSSLCILLLLWFITRIVFPSHSILMICAIVLIHIGIHRNLFMHYFMFLLFILLLASGVSILLIASLNHAVLFLSCYADFCTLPALLLEHVY